MADPNRNVRVGDAWNEAKASAARQHITLGEWISDAIKQKLDREQEMRMARLLGDSVVDIPESHE